MNTTLPFVSPENLVKDIELVVSMDDVEKEKLAKDLFDYALTLDMLVPENVMETIVKNEKEVKLALLKIFNWVEVGMYGIDIGQKFNEELGKLITR